MIRIVSGERAGETVYRAPDILWDGRVGSPAINALSHASAPGDFRAEQGLATQVLICLMTDRRADPSELRPGDINRGWAGDTFDVMDGETPIGSKLWLLRRSSLYTGIETKAEAYIREGLQPLLIQKAVVRIDVAVEADRSRNAMTYDIAMYGRDGAQVYHEKFEELWGQVNGVANPLAR